MMLPVSFLLLAAWGLLVLCLGGWGLSRLMDNNQCSMTYSRPMHRQVAVESNIQGFSLFEHIGDELQVDNDALPVLFVPGHSGSSDQMRSLASYMHSNGRYQFFGLDFNGSRSGLHGSYILAQAAFMNDALRTIIGLYSSSSPVDVLVVAHSMGGIVARASMALNNHPACSVSNLILLSSPNTRPSYSPDSSIMDVFHSVNLAWKHSFYNETAACLMRPSPEASGAEGNNLTANWVCPPCSARTRVVSITGGDVDYMVPAPLTLLRSIEPGERNSSAVTPTPVPIVSAIKPKGGFVRYVFSATKRLVMGAYNMMTGSGSENGNHTDVNTVEDPKGEPVPPVEDEYANYSSRDRQLLGFTEESWTMDMLPHIQPQHFTFRTQMLSGVGFTVDHLAILWCHQVMSVVHKLMDKLSDVPYGDRVTVPLVGSSGDGLDNSALWIDVNDDPNAVVWPLRGIVKRKYLSVSGTSGSKGRITNKGNSSSSQHKVISPIAAVLRRNALAAAWKRATYEERQMMNDFFNTEGSTKDSSNPLQILYDILTFVICKLRIGSFVTIAVIFVSQRIQTICLVYTAVSFLALLVPVMDRISLSRTARRRNNHGNNSLFVIHEWIRLGTPRVHLMVDFWAYVFAATLGENLFRSLSTLIFTGYPFGQLSYIPPLMKAFIKVSMALLLLYPVVNQFGGQYVEHIESQNVLGMLVEWSSAYGVAILLWLSVGITLSAVQKLANVLFWAPIGYLPFWKSGNKGTKASNAGSGGNSNSSLWTYLSGRDDSHLRTVTRPSAVRLLFLTLSPALLITPVYAISYIYFDAWGRSGLLGLLCASNISLFSIFLVLWLSCVFVPPASQRLPQWYRGLSSTGVKTEFAPFSPILMLQLSAGVTWPVVFLACPSFEFSISVLFGKLEALSFLASVCESFHLRYLSQLIMMENERLALSNLNVIVLRDIMGLFAPGMVSITCTLYACSIFLVIARSEPIFDQIRPVAWLCELSGLGHSIVKKILKNIFNVRSSMENTNLKPDRSNTSSSIFMNDSEDSRIPKKRNRPCSSIEHEMFDCCHEDGGKYAVFEMLTEAVDDVSRNGDGSVLLGCTYYVVSCRCHEDKALTKGRVEWCEWCRCARCGGKYNNTSADKSESSWLSKFIEVPDTNADVALLAAMLGAFVWSIMYINDYLFRIAHCIGLVCMSFGVHRALLFYGY